MPQPIPEGLGVGLGHVVLLDKPDLAAMIAAIASEWAGVEDELGRLLATILVSDPVPPTRMFYAIGSLNARLDALRAAAEAKLPREKYKQLSENLILTIKKRSKERSNLIHAKWGESRDYPDALIWAAPFWHKDFGKFLAYQKDDFQQILDRIIDLHARLREFRTDIQILAP